MVSFDAIYSQFLSSVPDAGSDFALLTNEEVREELFNWLVPALANFKFPHVSLEYTTIDNNGVISHEFTDKRVSQNEINVILALMRVQWIESIINRENRFEQFYYDANMRTHSQGALMAQLNRRYNDLRRVAKEEMFNYSRVKLDGKADVDRYKW